ncbi:TPA: hypothetical protein MYH73_001889 [Klebsiella variicola]|nr:hypothetical protein [Klebsiella variicola]HCA8413410.1 hypothetical protein [Klebsiella variicola]HCA9018959.1 hypothetical protein [Klebsiella variicola]HCA9035908.1 hypothetical protein [Klebsiella variicola]HCA9051805.1 hypothetical protein [Klebsiella variicola]
MTITLQAVNELIQSLESAGELAKAYQQLAAENVGLKSAIADHSQSVHFCEVCGKDDPCSTDDVCYVLRETPATDRIVAGIKADGVEQAANECYGAGYICETLLAYAQQLREGADK